MDLDQALQTYLVEARELLVEMESALLSLESTPGDDELIGAVFRAAHTIKGSAGLFGLTPIIGFTHIVEDILDQVRNHRLAISAPLIKVLLESCDHINLLVSTVVEQGEEPTPGDLAREAALRERLLVWQPREASPLPQTLGGEPVQVERDPPRGTSGLWHISLRFGAEVFKNGMEPTSFLRYLATLGKIVTMETITGAIPPWQEFDPELCHLGYEIDFDSSASKESIAEVFEFVRDDCRIVILPPDSKVEEYLAFMAALPEESELLGQLLVKSGALTQAELDTGLCQQREEATSPRLGEILVAQGAVDEVVLDAALKKQNQGKEQKNREQRFVRVPADKLDDLINLVGELVVASSGANLLAQRCRDSQLQEATSVIAMLVEEIRDGALHLRMVPIGETFNRFQRVVRDVSQELGKDIVLRISGADTELDKSVVEKIGDPLMHLVRNAMDHGIESAERRRLAGKPSQGTLTLNAFHDSGSIVLEIRDDGAGLDRERILKKALERDILSPGQQLSDQEIYQLIFEPGFSTAEEVTKLSGRGVGMDVVKRNIQALRGSVELHSEAGKGTLVRIRLPLTLAIIDGFLVRVGSAHYVIPLDMVIECVELTELALQDTQGRDYINLRGEVLPFVRLQRYFALSGQPGRRENIVVVSHGGQKSGLVVDELLGELQTVIKPLGKLYNQLSGISGSTILGGGDIALILDIPALLQSAIRRELHQLNHTGAGSPQSQPSIN
ncbi:chemotaxis protein CheW [Aeromonas bivalvium]|uniref:Chemotaxis protein CheA n=1 Tax=Aeromonas bivalvium TaxID=440079 RepID=A0ABW9GMP9_9GAMM